MIPVIDLHEDPSVYFMWHGEGQPLADFGLDIPGRVIDIPKYIRGNVKIVFASIFPAVERFNPEESNKLLKLFGKYIPAIGFRAPQSIMFEQISIYYRLAEYYKEIIIVETVNDVENVLRSSGKIGFCST